MSVIAPGKSAALPFSLRARHWWRRPRVAAVIHIYYSDLADEIFHFLSNIEFSCDLYISTDTEHKKHILNNCFSRWGRGSVSIKVMVNCGRDIAPKLVGYRSIYEYYDFVLHLHGKQSSHDPALRGWRRFLLAHLVGSPANVNSIFDAFRRRRDLGMVACQHFEPIRRFLNIGDGTRQIVDRLASRLGTSLPPALDYPTGSMFWARTAALRPLLGLDLTLADFPPESGQVGGTLAHAIEWLYFVSCEIAGLRWCKVAIPELFVRTSGIVTIDSSKALDQVIDESHLLGQAISANV